MGEGRRCCSPAPPPWLTLNSILAVSRVARDVQRHLAQVPRCNHVFLEGIQQVNTGVYDFYCSFGS